MYQVRLQTYLCVHAHIMHMLREVGYVCVCVCLCVCVISFQLSSECREATSKRMQMNTGLSTTNYLSFLTAQCAVFQVELHFQVCFVILYSLNTYQLEAGGKSLRRVQGSRKEPRF